MSTTWGQEAARELRAYILNAAANADVGINSVADLSRATGIKQSVFSKWFSGTEQPSVRSLQKLAPVIKAPLRDLLVLACRVSEADLAMTGPPEPPEVIGHPLARELDRLLAAESDLSKPDRDRLAFMVDTALARWRTRRARRDTG